MTTTKRTELVNTAKEMIDVMELEEENGEAPIPTDKKTKAKTIERKILEAAEYIEEDDKFSSETTATLKALGVEIEAEKEEEKELDFDEEAQEPEEGNEEEAEADAEAAGEDAEKEAEEAAEQEKESDEEPETEVDEKEDSVNKGKVVYTKNAIKRMDKKKLESVAKGISIDLDDYRGKLKDLRQAVMDKMGFGDVEEPEEKEEAVNESTAKTSFSFLEVKAAKKLQDLKDIVMADDRFKKLRKELGEHKGLEGTKALKEKMLSCFKQSEVPEKAEAKKGTGKGKGRGKSTKFSPDQTIEILVDKNPKRKGAACYDRFDLYKNGMTVKEYLNAGGIGADLPWDVAREFIAIK